ncbi:MAG: hypothetical protein HYW27_02530 [Candidatus Aenigmarchaeota archaeon]|nr:hypothetical protein [Candidatus Aenigmarchaeota archaeon]
MSETGPRDPLDDVETLPQDYRVQLGERIRHVREGMEGLYDTFKEGLMRVPYPGDPYRPDISGSPTFNAMAMVARQKAYSGRAEAIVDILQSYMRGNDVGATADSASVGKEYTTRLFRALGFSEEDAETIWNMGMSEFR